MKELKSLSRDMYRVCNFRMDPNLVVRLAADKNFYLRLTVENAHAFEIFNYKYLRPYLCNDTNFLAVIKCAISKTEIQSEILKLSFLLC